MASHDNTTSHEADFQKNLYIDTMKWYDFVSRAPGWNPKASNEADFQKHLKHLYLETIKWETMKWNEFQNLKTPQAQGGDPGCNPR